MSKKICVLFTGGLDSTYLIWKNLKDGNEVIPVYFEIENNKNKTILEKNRIDLILTKLHVDFSGKAILHDIDYGLSVNIKSHGDGLLFKQIPIFIMGAIYLAGDNVDEIQLGYVMNDDAISYINEIQKIYKSYKPIVDNLTPMTFPLTKVSKHNILSELPKEIIDLTVNCENPHIIGSEDDRVIDYEPCGRCVPCAKTNMYGYSSKHIKIKFENAVKLVESDGYRVVDSNGKEYFSKELTPITFEDMYPYGKQLQIDFDDDIGLIEREEELEEKIV
jgi:hypothetical protein